MELLRPSSLDDARRAADRLPLAGGTEVVPLLRDGLLEADDARRRARRCCRAAIDGTRIGAATTLAELEAADADPGRAARGRAPRRLAAAAEHGHGRRQPAPVDALLVLAARRCRAACTAATRCLAADGEHREHAIFGNDFCASAHPSDLAAALRRARRDAADEPARAAGRRALPPADRGRPAHDDARAGRADPRARRAAGRRARSTSRRWSASAGRSRSSASPPSGAAARRPSRSRASRRSRGCSTAPLDEATPLPGTAYKVEIAAALVRRARAAVA